MQIRRVLALWSALVVVMTALVGLAPQAAHAAGTGDSGGRYVPLAPSRVLDTRTGVGVSTAAFLQGQSFLRLQLAGRGGVPASGAVAVLLNTTVTDSAGGGHLSVVPTPGAAPSVSNLNFRAGQTVANLVLADLAADGSVQIYNGSFGAANVVADVQGYYTSGTPVSGGLAPMEPRRILDSRTGVGIQAGPVPAFFAAPAGTAQGLPAGVGSVLLNVTATNTTAGGYVGLAVGPGSKPVSNLNYGPGDTVPNLVLAPVVDGQVQFARGGSDAVDVIVDLFGYYSSTPLPASESPFGLTGPLNAMRIMDTRVDPNPNQQWADLGGRDHYTEYELKLDNFPQIQAGTGAVVLNVTVTNTTGSGYVALFPSGTPAPLASNLNFSAGQTRANAVVAKVGPSNRVMIRVVGAFASVVVDLFGRVTSGTPRRMEWGSPSAAGTANTVTCASSTLCLGTRNTVPPNIVAWDGSGWHVPQGWDAKVYVRNATCPSAAGCYVLGDDSRLWRYQGTSWTVMPAFPVAGLLSFGCSSATACWGTGGFPEVSYAFDGTTWASSPGTPPAPNTCWGVRCLGACAPGADQCLNLQYSSTSEGTFWVTGGSGGSGYAPTGVMSLSCATATLCAGGASIGAVALWDGVTWTPDEPVFTSTTPVTSISCVQTICAAANQDGALVVGTRVG